MNTDLLIIKTINKEKIDTIKKGYDARIDIDGCSNVYRLKHRSEWLVDRLKFLAFLFILPFRFMIHNDSINEKQVIIGSDFEEESWKYFILKHFKHKTDFLGFYKKIKVEKKRKSEFWKLWTSFVYVGICAFFDFRMVNIRHFSRTVDMCLKLLVIQDRIECIYAFYLVEIHNYLAVEFASKRCDVEINLMMGQNSLFSNRYFQLEKANMYLMSLFQTEEIKYYFADASIKVNKYVYLGSEDAIDFDGVQCKEPVCDIAFMSVGAWARREGVYRLASKEQIEKNMKQENSIGELEKKYFIKLMEYAKKNGLTLKLYPHPYERDIYKKYKIASPLNEYVDGVTVILDDVSDTNSHKRLWEARIAVAIISSSIWQRIDRGYGWGFLYEYNKVIKKPAYDKNAMGKYKEVFFSNEEELFDKLDKLLLF